MNWIKTTFKYHTKNIQFSLCHGFEALRKQFKKKNCTLFIITEIKTLLKTNMSLLFHKNKSAYHQYEPEEVTMQYNYVYCNTFILYVFIC